jgi:hypothetical protein
MRLPGHDRRALARIDETLTRHDPTLAAKFRTFTRLTQDDGVPVTERLRSGWNKLLVTLLLPVVLVAGLVAARYGPRAAVHRCGGPVAAACGLTWRSGFAWARTVAKQAKHPARPGSACAAFGNGGVRGAAVRC